MDLTGVASIQFDARLGGHAWRFPLRDLVSGALSLSLAPDPGDIEDLAGNDLANVQWSYPVDIVTYIIDTNHLVISSFCLDGSLTWTDSATVKVPMFYRVIRTSTPVTP